MISVLLVQLMFVYGTERNAGRNLNQIHLSASFITEMLDLVPNETCLKYDDGIRFFGTKIENSYFKDKLKLKRLAEKNRRQL
jgi:hypothetical protein